MLTLAIRRRYVVSVLKAARGQVARLARRLDSSGVVRGRACLSTSPTFAGEVNSLKSLHRTR